MRSKCPEELPVFSYLGDFDTGDIKLKVEDVSKCPTERPVFAYGKLLNHIALSPAKQRRNARPSGLACPTGGFATGTFALTVIG
jgi:hypothetical protein